MLLIRCAGCNRKLWKYNKIGTGKVLRCYKSRMTRIYNIETKENVVRCVCGKRIGIDKGRYIQMLTRSFTHSGTKTSV